MLKRTQLKRKYKPKTEEEKAEKWEMFQLFLEIWDERANEFGQCKDFETGEWLSPSLRNSSLCFHHILEKAQYKQYKFTKANIIIISPEIHNSLHLDVTKYSKIVKYRNKLLNLHNEGQL